MTAFVGVADMVEWITRRGAETIMAEMADTIEEDFRRWESFDKSERVANHTPFGVIELMPISDPDLYAFKYVNGHPFNPGRGYQTVTAFGVLADVHNGYPVFLAEMTLLTALRTAATSAMVARRLARADSSTMAMIGAGSQAEFQALAFRGVLGISRLRIYDVDPAASEKFVRNLASRGFDITVCGSAAEAASGADIVTTCTADKAVAQVLKDADVTSGMHINTIGGDCPGKTELDPRILERGPVFVEYTPQTRVEGEIQNVAADFPVTEFWQVLAGLAAGRTSDEQVTIFDSVGFAIEDFSALRHLRADLAGAGFETEIDLVAAPEDPKDLFGFAHAPVPAR
ncbi:ornithine cyclodeaminase [Microbacterium sp. TPD7012]|uniref:ornithine cyclodeaminase n=1 Tax=Microbacterium sp. TPD7012 TaxID=2171975 RepID=UPI000D50D07A|nr:ornithine cyclodeaminase [Microbacterium sp. TPD7012]PVE98234.1 ornithine cyclodeaminase [Microbacterium sp. TPD7012]